MATAHAHDDGMIGRFVQAADAIGFMLAGNATFTVQSNKTGKHFTFKVQKSHPSPQHPRRPNETTWFVRVLANGDQYQYHGLLIRRDFNIESPFIYKPKWAGSDSAKAFEYVMNHVLNHHHLPPGTDLWHEGRCGRCGRKLTRPESISSGMGPECAGKE